MKPGLLPATPGLSRIIKTCRFRFAGLSFLLLVLLASLASCNFQPRPVSDDLLFLPPAHGISADRPPFTFEANGVYGQPWGAAGMWWPQQLFWENVPEISTKHFEMNFEAANIEASGRAAILGCVAWGFEYGAATGGVPAANLPDNSALPGWKEYGEWLQPRKDKYFALDWEGNIIYPYAGYVTPLMQLDPPDYPAGYGNKTWGKGLGGATFGEFQGVKLGKLCLEIGCRGMYGADFVIGLYGQNHDYHPRVIDAFQAWSGITVPGATVRERSDFISTHCLPEWNDFKSFQFARFYRAFARVLTDAGRQPLFGGQLLGTPGLNRGYGDDLREYEKLVDPSFFFFQMELQSDPLRPVKDYWNTSVVMGVNASRTPSIALGAHMDCDHSSFWDAVHNLNQKDDAWGWKYLRHHWLSVGWTHVLGADGQVRRAPQSFQRGYWDVGGTDPALLQAIMAHIPRKPFGPAFYYSVPIERSFETNLNNVWWWGMEKFQLHRSTGRELDGLCLGYFASDAGINNLNPDNRPTAWIVEDADRLTADERAKLLAQAPVFDPATQGSDILKAGPVRIDIPGVSGMAFLDQFDQVVLMVSNSNEFPVAGSIHFNRIAEGNYVMTGLLDSPDTGLSIRQGTGKAGLVMDARSTLVWVIPGMKLIR